MSDLISKQRAIEAIDKFIPADPMMSDYTQGISVGLAIATRCIEEFSQENDDSSQGLVKDLISRKDAIEAVEDTDWYHQNKKGEMVHGANPSDHQAWYKAEDIYNVLESLPSAEPKTPSNGSITSMNAEKMHVRTTDDCISRQEAKDAIDMALDHIDHVPPWVYDKLLNVLNEVPSAEKAQLSGEDATKDATSDLISRKKTLDMIRTLQTYKLFEGDDMILVDKADVQTELMMSPSAGGCKCPCEYREPCDYCHYDAYRGHGCPAEDGMKDG